VDGVELAYQELGSGERPLVLVHGFTGSSLDFADRIPELARVGWTLAPDLRGHGASANTGAAADYSLDRLAADLVALLDAVGAARCDLLGHSLGGMVALRAVLARPERFASLVLMCSAARAPDGLPLEVFRRGWQLAREAGMARLFDVYRTFLAADPNRPGPDRRLEREWGDRYWRWRGENYRAMDPEAYAALGRELVEQAPLLTRLAEVRCPTLVMVGELDRSFLAAADELAAGIPGARRVTIADAAHQPQLENAPAWTSAILDHLERVRRPEAPAVAPQEDPWPSTA
jgi:2-succinyl-6-hydroxy-2,4-cyclohexadiene-1-carboxylate synthase